MPFIPKREPLVTSEVIEATENKRIIWHKYISSGKDCHKNLRKQHKVACKNVTKVVKAAVYAYEEGLVKDSKIDQKLHYNHVRSKQYIQDIIHSLEKDGFITIEHREICSILNDYFESVFVKEPTGDMPVFEICT